MNPKTKALIAGFITAVLAAAIIASVLIFAFGFAFSGVGTAIILGSSLGGAAVTGVAVGAGTYCCSK